MRIQTGSLPWLLICGWLALSQAVQAKTTTLELISQISLDTTGDTDGDRLSDGLERIVFGLNPELADSDGDDLSDFFELLRQTNPLQHAAPDTTATLELIASLQLDTTEDSDDDRLSNGLERVVLGLDPLLADSDGDGESDFAEILRGLNALSPETAAPIVKTLELLASLSLDTTDDSDGDGLTDGAESNRWFTSVNLADSDLDGVLDFREILLQENPFHRARELVARTLELMAQLQLDTTVDRDQDGLSDGVEMHITFTDFRLLDTDGDGDPDNIEVLLGTNPFFHATPPDDLRPIVRVDSVIDNTLTLTIDAAGAKRITLEATNDFANWETIATITVEANDPNPPSVAIPTDTDHAFFRIIRQE